VDLTIDKVLKPVSSGSITKSKVTLPEYREVQLENNRWFLPNGEYIVSYQQIIKIPDNAVGFVYPRSSLMRMGAMLFTAVWDPGYVGKGSSLLVVYNKKGITLEKGARIAQLVLIEARPTGIYRGRYHGEGLTK